MGGKRGVGGSPHRTCLGPKISLHDATEPVPASSTVSERGVALCRKENYGFRKSQGSHPVGG